MRNADGKSRNDPLSSVAGEAVSLDPGMRNEFPITGNTFPGFRSEPSNETESNFLSLLNTLAPKEYKR
jgi:hypothetical protein